MVLDTSCYDTLRNDEIREGMVRDIAVANLRACPSTLNLLEVSKHPNTSKRKALLSTIGDLRGGRPLLPWPYDLLRQVGESIVVNEDRFQVAETGSEWMTEEPFEIEQDVLDEANRFLGALEQVFDEMHENGRGVVQQFMKERSLRGTWEDAVEFLEDQWTKPEQVDVLIHGVWESLGIEGRPSDEDILDNRAFSLLIDAFGVALFERTVLVNEPKRVQYADLLQLVYLGSASGGIIVTADNGLYRAASAILDTRYEGLRAMRLVDFLT